MSYAFYNQFLAELLSSDSINESPLQANNRYFHAHACAHEKSPLNGNLTIGLFNPELEIIFKAVPTSSVLFVDAALVEPEFKGREIFFGTGRC